MGFFNKVFGDLQHDVMVILSDDDTGRRTGDNKET